MTELDHTADAPLTAASPARVLLYSDDYTVREQVRFAVGPECAGRELEWVECATHAAAMEHLHASEFDLAILDGEAAKVGGMAIARQIKLELFTAPAVLLLVGRPADAWLATWSEAEGAVAHPLDPFQVREAVTELLSKPTAA